MVEVVGPVGHDQLDSVEVRGGDGSLELEVLLLPLPRLPLH